MKTQILLSILTAASASLCCITPVLAIVAGTSSLATSFSWLDPLRPYFIGATFLVLGITWYGVLKSQKKDDCGCEPEKKSFFKSKSFVSTITILSLLLIAFPSYSKFFFQKSEPAVALQDQSKNKKIELTVNGMTCSSCEMHIESEVKKLPGVSFIKASYEKKSATIEYDEQKVDIDKIIASINSTGYKVDQSGMSLQQSLKKDCCSKPTACTSPTVSLPKEVNKNLMVLSDINEIKKTFNQQIGKTKFVAILSSTCGWCLQGAESVQKTIMEKAADKNISVMIIWTDMMKADDKENAFHAASLFKSKNVVQYFDADNKFGDIVAKSLNPKGEKAWDIYMFFDKDTQWNQKFPRPFDYAHQLNIVNHAWVDNTKYVCGDALTQRLEDITASL
jgi:mercuric ion transport protein